jgi:hypothetical protein
MTQSVTLPGVLTNNDFDTGVALRGTRPDDNRYYLDFLPTGYLFHITGLSVVDGDMVARLQLLSAGFGVSPRTLGTRPQIRRLELLTSV